MGFPIPRDKDNLFKILIMKDYYNQDERERKKQYAIQKLENDGKTIQNKLKKIDRKQESKIIS